MNIMTNLLCFYDFVIVVLFELDLAIECRHSVASCRFCSYLHVDAGSKCHLRKKHIWSYSTSFPHHLLLPTKSELNYQSGYARRRGTVSYQNMDSTDVRSKAQDC